MEWNNVTVGSLARSAASLPELRPASHAMPIGVARERNGRPSPLSNNYGVSRGNVTTDGSSDLTQPARRTVMPYNSVADLPKAQTDQYNPHQKEAFLKAFNNAYKEYGGDESRAFAVAHSAAKKAGEKPGPG
jgi:cation transport regulator